MNRYDYTVNYYCQQDFFIKKWGDWDPSYLSEVRQDQRRGRDRKRMNEVFIMLDTETSKSGPDIYHMKKTRTDDGYRMIREYEDNVNYIVKWSMAIGYMGINICCTWGDRPTECVKAVESVHNSMRGDKTIIYIHNLAYDWRFLRKFMILAWGEPCNQINTKPYYPIMIEFDNGVQLRDSLILAQRKLEKWGEDLNVLHQKAVGNWEYDKIRNQSDTISEDEILYITNDAICGVECLNQLRRTLRKQYSGMPYTATGIVRNECRSIGEGSNAHEEYIKRMADFEWYQAALKCYHGGYTHANRFVIGWIENDVECYDFASSYPYVMLAEKFPCEKFKKVDFPVSKADVLSGDCCCMIHIVASGIELKDYFNPMPNLQVSKCEHVLNPIVDNGRILKADFLDIYLNEIDFGIIDSQYNFEKLNIIECWIAQKDYLSRWFTDYVYEAFRNKTKYKGGDPVLYAIYKSIVNSLYGMTVQKICRDDIIEQYDTGEYVITENITEDEYNKIIKRRTSFLPYYIGVYVTSYAMRNLYLLGQCVETWLYSDTDSIYGIGWNRDRLNDYNKFCKTILKGRGYPGIEHNGKEYWLGVAELDGQYSEFVTVGAKRYCCRDAETGKLKITVAGVPKKKGVQCLNDDIRNFKKGFIFDGDTTGKLTHVYNQVDDIYIDDKGNEIGDSINLIPCDYLLDNAKIDDMFMEEVQINTFGAD